MHKNAFFYFCLKKEIKLLYKGDFLNSKQLQRRIGERHKASEGEEEKEKLKKGGADVDKIAKHK